MNCDEAFLRKARDFIDHEGVLSRTAQYRIWLDLFTTDGRYWLPVSPTQADWKTGPSHINEARPALDARIERLCDTRVVPQTPPSRVSRLVGKPWLARMSENVAQVTVTFHVMEARAMPGVQDRMRLFAGEATYSLVHDDAGFEALRIQSKRVDLINSESAFFGVSILL